MADRMISEIYRIKEYEVEFGKRLAPIMADLGAWRAMGGMNAQPWSRDHHLIFISDDKDWKRRNEVVFSEHRYDPSNSIIVYGRPVVIEEDKVKVDGFSRTFDHTKYSEDVPVHIAEEIKLSKNVLHTLAHQYNMSVESETQMSGSYGGVEFQETLKIAFGMQFDDSETQSEGTDITQSVSEDLTIKAGTKVIVGFEKNKIITETPFAVKGCIDFAIWLNFEDWASEQVGQGHLLFKGWHKGRKEYKFNSMLDFERFLKGYDVDYPQMSAYPTHASDSAKESMDWIFNKENRVIEAVGTKRREFENNVSIVPQEIN